MVFVLFLSHLLTLKPHETERAFACNIQNKREPFIVTGGGQMDPLPAPGVATVREKQK